jgi:hypothetical protein
VQCRLCSGPELTKQLKKWLKIFGPNILFLSTCLPRIFSCPCLLPLLLVIDCGYYPYSAAAVADQHHCHRSVAVICFNDCDPHRSVIDCSSQCSFTLFVDCIHSSVSPLLLLPSSELIGIHFLAVQSQVVLLCSHLITVCHSLEHSSPKSERANFSLLSVRLEAHYLAPRAG